MTDVPKTPPNPKKALTKKTANMFTKPSSSPDSEKSNQHLIFAPLFARDFVDWVGLGPIADSFGVWPTIVFIIVVVAVSVFLMAGGKSWVNRAKNASQDEIASRLRREIREEENDANVIQKVNDENNDVLTEAAQRLERRNKDITGENLEMVLGEIEDEGSDSDSEPTGLLNEEGDRAPVAKMSVAPSKIESHEDHIKVTADENDEYYSRTMIISAHPDQVTLGWLDKLFSSGLETKGADVRTSFHIWPRDTDKMMKKLDKKATKIRSQIRRKKKEGKINTIEEENTRKKVDRIRDQLSKGSTKIFDFSLYIQVVAETKESLKGGTEEAKQYLATSNAQLETFQDRQLSGFRSGAPLGQDHIRKTQLMHLNALGTIFPFIEPTRIQPSGVLMGFHQTTTSPVIVDRWALSGHNALISGKIGSGKSYLAKLMMWRRMMMDSNTELLIIDPVGGFSDLAESLGGQVVKINRETTINPLQIQQAEETTGEIEEDPYEMKIRSVMGMFKTHFSGDRTLSKGEEGVLRRAIKYAYLQKGITKDPNTHSRESPTIQDVIDILKGISRESDPIEFLDVDEELTKFVGTVKDDIGDRKSNNSQKNTDREAGYAHNLLLGLEEFTAGGQRENLNGHMNIDLDAQVVAFDLDNVVDPNNAGLIMHIMLDTLFQRAKSTSNRTLVTIDEAHYMLGSEGSTGMLNTFARHSRHYKAGMTLISQTVDEFMEGPAKEIYDQCDIRLLMRHEDIGPEAMEALGLEPPERDFVLSAQAGNTADYSEALLFTTNMGKRRIRVYSNPFEHHIVDSDSINVWAFLYGNDSIKWETIPETKKPIVRRTLESPEMQNSGLQSPPSKA